MGNSDDELQKNLGKSNLVKIIGQFTKLKKSGSGYVGKCPFPDHSGHGRHMFVSLKQQIYYCFKCRKSGNAVTFLQDFAGMTFSEAVMYLLDENTEPEV